MNKRLLSFLFCVLTSVITASAQPALDGAREADRAAIRAHVEKIFQAYIDKDSATIRATHSADWEGYLSPSRTLKKGIEEYMQQAVSQRTKDARMISYKFSEFEIKFEGDVALVFYIADVEGRNAGGQGANKLRSLDVYAKRNGDWIQIASHLTIHPDAVAEQSSRPVPVSPQLRQRILEAREAVWRAWFTNDQATLEKIIPENAIAVYSGEEKWLNRADILAGSKQFAGSGARLVRLEFPRTEIQMYGSTITLYTTYAYETESGGKRTASSGRGTETFVLRNNELFNTGWLLAAGK